MDNNLSDLSHLNDLNLDDSDFIEVIKPFDSDHCRIYNSIYRIKINPLWMNNIESLTILDDFEEPSEFDSITLYVDDKIYVSILISALRHFNKINKIKGIATISMKLIMKCGYFPINLESSIVVH